MKHLKPFLAFALGCMTAMVFGVAVDVTAQRSNPSGGPGRTASLESWLAALEQRAKDLEQAAGGGQVNQKVVAPFEVRDRVGRPIFSVTDVVKVYSGGKERAQMFVGGDQGMFFAPWASGGVTASLGGGPDSFDMGENGLTRISLGMNDRKRNDRLEFKSNSRLIAQIGEDPGTHTGLALVFDKSGSLRARMAGGPDGGLVDVLGAKKVPIVQLTESHSKGGELLICGTNSCPPTMVEAGDAGGYGIVRAGPKGFNPGVTMLGLPGSVIAGKK
jgi:hypothetical protein